MPAKIVLGITILWCVYVFWEESRTKPDVSHALWLPTIWLIRCASRGIDRWFPAGGGNLSEERLDPVFLMVFIMCGLLVLLQRQIKWRKMLEANAFIFIFYAFMVLSVLWSIAPSTTLLKLARPTGDLVMAMIVISEKNPTTALITIFRRCMVLLIPVSLVLAKYFPSLGRAHSKHWLQDTWIGVATHKNTLGQLCLLSGITIAWCLDLGRRGRHLAARLFLTSIPVDLVYVFMVVFLLNGGGHSRSSTSIVCLILAISILWALTRYRKRARKILPVFFSCLVGLLMLSLFMDIVLGFSFVNVIAELAGKDPTLAGRTILWQECVRLGTIHTLGGYGYGAFWGNWVYSVLDPRVDFGPEQCHNGYLEIYVNLGIIGVILMVMSVWNALRRAAEICGVDFDGGRLRITLLLVILALNFTEAAFPRGTHLFWYVFLLAALVYRPDFDIITVRASREIALLRSRLSSVQQKLKENQRTVSGHEKLNSFKFNRHV